MKRTVTVLQDDIDNGIRMSSTRCAVALAARRDLADLFQGEPGGVLVGMRHITGCAGDNGEVSLFAEITEEMYCWIAVFDESGPVEPAKFELEVQVSRTE